MSVAICNSSTVPFPREGFGSVLIPTWLPSANGNTAAAAAAAENREIFEREEINTTLPPLPPPPRQVDIWSSIQSQKKAELEETKDEPYVHPLVRHSSSLLSQKSLEVCTESLGSETGSDHYVSSEDEEILFSSSSPKNQQEHKQQVVDKQQVVAVDEEEEEESDDDDDDDDVYVEVRKKELATVNYHCSIGRRSPPRSFPPPLPSISNRSGPCFQMRPHRKDGRLVVEAVAVPSQNYLHSERQGGRLVLSFIQTDSKSPKHTYGTNSTTTTTVEVEEERQQQQPIEMEEEEEEDQEEEEVEVVDRGTVVEVKVSTQPQQQSGCGVAAKVHRSSIVINKFVSCTLPASSNGSTEDRHDHDHPITTTTGPTKRATTSTTTAAAAAVAASSLSTFPADGTHRSFDNKLLFTSKRRNSEELLRDMRRCHQLRKPLFIWEPCCIATSS